MGPGGDLGPASENYLKAPGFCWRSSAGAVKIGSATEPSLSAKHAVNTTRRRAERINLLCIHSSKILFVDLFGRKT